MQWRLTPLHPIHPHRLPELLVLLHDLVAVRLGREAPRRGRLCDLLAVLVRPNHEPNALALEPLRKGRCMDTDLHQEPGM